MFEKFFKHEKSTTKNEIVKNGINFRPKTSKSKTLDQAGPQNTNKTISTLFGFVVFFMLLRFNVVQHLFTQNNATTIFYCCVKIA